MLHRIRRPWPPPSATSFLVPLFLLISVLVSLLPPCSCYPYEYKKCGKRSLRCEHGTTIEVLYPFYENKSTSNCHLPEFELTCDLQNSTISIVVEDKRYYLVDDDDHIDYDHHSLTLLDKSFFDESCARSTPNFSLNPLFFNRSDPVVNVTFWECSDPNPQPPNSKISCFDGDTDTHYEYYYWPNSSIPGEVQDRLKTCPTWKVCMQKSAVERMNGSNINYEEALHMRFTGTWTLEVWRSCRDCIDSGGICGSLDESQVCFCGPHGSCPPPRDKHGRGDNSSAPDSSPGQGAKHIRPGIIIGGTFAGAVGLIVVCLVGFFFYRWRKRARRSGGLLSQTTSSFYPSSKMDTQMFSDQGPHTQIFQYEELHEATDGFSSTNELGEGGFGTVYKGNLADGRTVAIKRLHENNYRQVEQFRTEVSILSSLRHPNLVILYGCTSRHCRELILVYEYVPNGTVADHIHGPRASGDGLPWPIRMSIAIETAEALSFLHSASPQIIHRDVKTNNILLDNHFHVKVADFGLSRLFPLNATHVSTAPQGTPGYVDPEYHECYQLTDKSDVFSFGVVLVELISSKPAVDITRPRHEINLASLALSKIQSDQLDQLVDPKLWHQANDEVLWMVNHVAELAFRCLQEDSELRPTMREVADALRAIAGEACRRAKGATGDGGMNDDTFLLQSTRPQSPDTVTTEWSSTGTNTTPNLSG